MPQINRIRVNNVRYNFGTQFYDDFLMRFSCKNTIYDLANGGGKSVLMLLLLQNLIPNCTLDDKQPIEKLFRTESGSTVIHSLIEWKLDDCYIKDNYKYMTTGFCARKAKEDPGDTSKETASIEYFNYCIFYREFGDNDIRNLPLSNGKERVTYQGLKSYLKDLEKKDFNVSVKIFEKKSDYQQFITGYGLFESQWQIVRGINKTEGHVRTYFESNYKTSRKVVEDLLIEEIIEKSFNNRIGSDGEENMASTLLDIKDKLVELSKKKDTLENYDNQVEVLKAFTERLTEFKDIYDKKESIKERLLRGYASFKEMVSAIEKEQILLAERSENLNGERENISRNLSVCNVLEDEATLKELRGYLEERNAALNGLNDTRSRYANELKLKEAGLLYREYLEYEYKKAEIRETIDNRLRDFTDIKKELNEIAGMMHLIYDVEKGALEDSINAVTKEYNESHIALEELDKKLRECDRKVYAASEGLSECENKAKKLIVELTELMGEASILMTDDIETTVLGINRDYSESENEVNRLNAEYEDYKKRYESTHEQRITLSLKEEYYKSEIESRNAELLRLSGESEKIENLYSVYGENSPEKLIEKLTTMIDLSLVQKAELQSEIERLNGLSESIKNGEYQFNEAQYKKVYEYLSDTYGEDILAGDKWLKKQPISTRRDLLKRVPFITHSIIVKEDFERIKEDVTLKNMSNGAYIVPVVGEGILYETRNAVTSDCIYFAMKDISFLADEEKVGFELERITEEIDSLKGKLKKLSEREEVIKDDYNICLGLNVTSKEIERLKLVIADLEDKINSDKKNLDALINNENVYLEKMENAKGRLLTAKKKADECNERLKAVSLVKKTKQDIAENDDRRSELSASLKVSQRELERLGISISETKDGLNILEGRLTRLNDEKNKLISDWEKNYLPYYDENISLTPEKKPEELRARFMGLKAVIDTDASDISDKEKLFEAFDNSAKKALSDIEYLGTKIDEVKALFESGSLEVRDRSELLNVKNAKERIEEQIENLQSEILAQSALVNRTEGSVWHARKEIAEKYGEFEYPAIENISVYREENKQALKATNEAIKNLKTEEKSISDRYTKTLVTLKEQERLLANVGFDSEALAAAQLVEGDNVLSEDEIRDTTKQLDMLIKDENKKKENFFKEKQKLKDELNRLLAFELAFEVEESINVPASTEAANNLVENIYETIKCIELERDRIGKGIEDMERIKDSFENRCLQTCDNIRTELERLPKLSKINLDGEVIPIVELKIPYVKDEFKKERMSSYIDEVIIGSESYKDADERLKYIRSKLTWKKLFSVIVTDMNSIKLNLYKRERIAGQSKFLKYEEAVGSTGQSQGIYIQFLIAVINYISSINEATAQIVGKTIFIDNPFGAAKDVYIWEPIFKLLKTNHVQLVVPARGTTPAIIGKFDVNYILGQKLVGGAWQTVVVDYRSEADSEKIEYQRLEFTQETLNLI